MAYFLVLLSVFFRLTPPAFSVDSGFDILRTLHNNLFT
jgi:hypothetical protein